MDSGSKLAESPSAENIIFPIIIIFGGTYSQFSNLNVQQKVKIFLQVRHKDWPRGMDVKLQVLNYSLPRQRSRVSNQSGV